ncbi:MAG: DUF6438 domain-containing protein [Deltaproteobacteria bacterium]|nr:DUF6438 domain-containing protein [Deltaproteobacteria bacterium]
MRVLLLVGVVTGCGAARPAPAPGNVVEIVPAAPSTTRPLQPGDNQLLVSLRHTACMGQCPVYSVELYASGLVCWNGERCGIDVPEHELRVPADEVARVIAAFEAARFLDRDAAGQLPGAAPDPRRVRCFDTPGVIVTFAHDGRSNTIEDRQCDGPNPLGPLERLVDDITRSHQPDTAPDGLR